MKLTQNSRMPKRGVKKSLTRDRVIERFKQRLAQQIQNMVIESGNPNGFVASAWLEKWMERPLPVLAGKRPVECLGTLEGRNHIEQLISCMQSGAFCLECVGGI